MVPSLALLLFGASSLICSRKRIKLFATRHAILFLLFRVVTFVGSDLLLAQIEIRIHGRLGFVGVVNLPTLIRADLLFADVELFVNAIKFVNKHSCTSAAAHITTDLHRRTPIRSTIFRGSDPCSSV